MIVGDRLVDGSKAGSKFVSHKYHLLQKLSMNGLKIFSQTKSLFWNIHLILANLVVQNFLNVGLKKQSATSFQNMKSRHRDQEQ